MRHAGPSLSGHGPPVPVDRADLEVLVAPQAHRACVPAWVAVRVWLPAHAGPCIRRVPSRVVLGDPAVLEVPADVPASARVPALAPALAWADVRAWVAPAPA